MLQVPSPCHARAGSLGSDILFAIGPYAPAGLAPWIHNVRGWSLLALFLTAVVCHHEKDGDDEEYPQQDGDCSKQHKGICDGHGIARWRCRGSEQRLPDHRSQYSSATAAGRIDRGPRHTIIRLKTTVASGSDPAAQRREGMCGKSRFPVYRGATPPAYTTGTT